MLRKVGKILQRSQRGIRVKKGDLFLRNGRLVMVTEVADGLLTLVESAGGSTREMSLQEFRSRQIQRVKISDPARRSAIDSANEIMDSISLSLDAKISALRSLAKSSSVADRMEIRKIIEIAVRALRS